MRVDAHRLAELRSLAYHREVARRLHEQPELLERARLQAQRGLQDPHAAPYFQRWESLLAGPLDALVHSMTTDDDESRALRQCTPFAGALPPRERWELWRSVRADWAGTS